jgi:diguanylate cyclase (GGDEF)-like protein
VTAPVRCDDRDPCTTDRCDPASGCAPTRLPGCCGATEECDTPRELCLADRSLCVPALCWPCHRDEDCGATGNRCVPLPSGRFCGIDARAGDCPDGARATEVTGGGPQCLPEAGDCQCLPHAFRDCVDGDVFWMTSCREAEDVASPLAWLRRTVSVTVGSALERLLDRARLLRTGVSDSVAGWHSRVYFQGRLREEIARCQRRNGELACMLIDVDGLRAVNDLHGQLAGDILLNEVAERLQTQVRASDSAAHLGGDEFAVILPDCGVEAAIALAQRILHAVRSAPVRLSNEVAWPVTVSIGIAGLRALPENDRKTVADHLLANASAALHGAKLDGRDRYRVTAVG